MIPLLMKWTNDVFNKEHIHTLQTGHVVRTLHPGCWETPAVGGEGQVTWRMGDLCPACVPASHQVSAGTLIRNTGYCEVNIFIIVPLYIII